MFGSKHRQQVIDRLVDLRFRQMQLDDRLHQMAIDARSNHRESMEAWRIVVQNLQQYNEMIAALTAKVKSQTDIDTSAVALIQGLKAQINDLITRTDGIVDVSQLQNLASALDVGTSALAAAVAANTAPAPAPVDQTTTVTDPAPVTGAGTDPNVPSS